VGELIETRDRDRLRALLARDAELHVYELGDLDDRFWPHTRWWVRGDAVVLLYAALEPPVLVALGGLASHAALLDELVAAGELPAELYAHLSPGLAATLAARFEIASRGPHLKMALRRRVAAEPVGVVSLGPADADELVAFYADAYPGNWFEPRVLDTGLYVGVRDAGRLVAAAGVHVFSASERVAALGNIAVAPRARGRGHSVAVTAAVCRKLEPLVDVVGLNVKSVNAAALAAYRRVGFEPVAPYEELRLTRRA
jgi:ribosomal protein S18 acetylase RimI-like enzyme